MAPLKVSRPRLPPAPEPTESRVALRGKLAYEKYMADRKDAVCSTVDPKGFAADPGDYVYTRDHCRPKGRKNEKSPKGAEKKSADSDAPVVETKDHKKELGAFKAVVKKQLADKGTKALLTNEDETQKIVRTITGKMLLPYYRTKYPDPEKRYEQIKKDLKIKHADPKFAVMSQIVVILDALEANDRKK